ncbi:MAG: hypothetical protein BGP03_00420 [Pseudonocardia sp. 73-21]|uniref:hypothetical protein n=1 Tax=uncultured Pseudonocardia sp. TaxID=211455 RepID=UPI000962D7BC|nr:hypothetical protein [uncultured Pseudonocardia sp.]OJY40315.1 MAG: hypothetical protein BGP03_00420 [Pseudonocardia sp. 73-21]
MLAEHLKPRCVQIEVPVDAQGGFVDSGRWREKGVTHWNLLRRDWGRNDRERFDNERRAADRHRPSHGVARSPHEVADWLIEEALRAAGESHEAAEMLRSDGVDTEEGVALKREVLFWSAMHGRDVFSMMGLSSARIADLSAYAMTD